MRLLLTYLKLEASIQLQAPTAMASFLQYHSVENETTPRRMTTPGTSNDPGIGISIVVLYQDIVGRRRVTLITMPALGRHSLQNHPTDPIPETNIHNLLVATDYKLMGAWFRMTRYRRPATTQDIIARLISIDWVAMIKAIRIYHHHRRSGFASATQAMIVVESGSDLERRARQTVDTSANVRVH